MALQSTALWAKIDLSLPSLALVHVCLDRSNGALLDVTYKQTESQDFTLPRDVFALLLQHRDRIQGIDLKVPSVVFGELVKLLADPLPNLTYLRLRHWDTGNAVDFPEAIGSDRLWDTLHTLVIGRVHFPRGWMIHRFAALRVVKINFLHRPGNDFTLQDLLQMLRCCNTTLEVLKVSTTLEIGRMEPVIDLSRLRKLSLQSCSNA